MSLLIFLIVEIGFSVALLYIVLLSFAAVAMSINSVVRLCFSSFETLTKKRPSNKCITYTARSFGLVSATLLVSVWLYNRHWAISDIVCACIVMLLLRLIKVTSLLMAIIAILMFSLLSVVIRVFIYQTSLTLDVMADTNIPFYFQIPYLDSGAEPDCQTLDFDSLLFPAVFMAFAYKYDNAKRRNVYFRSALAGFVIGICLCELTAIFLNFQMYQVVFTLPMILVFILVSALCTKNSKGVWVGINPEEVEVEVENQEIEALGATDKKRISDDNRVRKVELERYDDRWTSKSSMNISMSSMMGLKHCEKF